MPVPHKLHFILTERVYQFSVYEKILDWVLNESTYRVYIWSNSYNRERLRADFRNFLLRRIGRIHFDAPEQYVETGIDIVKGRQPKVEIHTPNREEYEDFFFMRENDDGLEMFATDPVTGLHHRIIFADYNRLNLKKGSKIADDEEHLWRNKTAAMSFYRLWILYEHGGIVLDANAKYPGRPLPREISPPHQVLFKIIFGNGMPRPSPIIMVAIPESQKIYEILHTQMILYRDEYEPSGDSLSDAGYSVLHEHLLHRQSSEYPWKVGNKLFDNSKLLRELGYNYLKKKRQKIQEGHRQKYIEASRIRSQKKDAGKALDAWLMDYEGVKQRLAFQTKRFEPTVRHHETADGFDYIDYEAPESVNAPSDLDFFRISVAEREYTPYSFDHMTGFEIQFSEGVILEQSPEDLEESYLFT